MSIDDGIDIEADVYSDRVVAKTLRVVIRDCVGK